MTLVALGCGDGDGPTEVLPGPDLLLSAYDVTVATPALAWGGYAAGVIVGSDDAGNGSQLVVISVHLECPPPSAGKATVCGRFYDTGTDDVTHAALSAVAYDAVEYSGNPTAATPLGTADTDASVWSSAPAADVPGLIWVVLHYPVAS